MFYNELENFQNLCQKQDNLWLLFGVKPHSLSKSNIEYYYHSVVCTGCMYIQHYTYPKMY